MSIVVREDLNMSTGKIVAQACHACLEVYEKAKKRKDGYWRAWRKEGAKKVILKVGSLEKLLELEKRAKRLKLPCVLIVDRGLTEVPPNTPTALGVGPSRSELIDKVTGGLPLL
ncbi:MAG: peptidyl-tRNA hydrolase [archaeon]|nr:peptidyl-tRNA hydrolase [archaeon]MCP8306316.1 peptidyl-tRNA hydrolase [archaeon]